MKILIIDRDEITTQLLQSKLSAMGQEVHIESVKNEAISRLESEQFDAVFLDPAPLKGAKSTVLDIRRKIGNYLYIFLMSGETNVQAAITEGVNDVFPKPLQVSLLEEKIFNAQRFARFISHIGDDSEDFPSAGGVISKSAFAQLLLSTLDRAGRYGERSFVMIISISNYREILEMDGNYGADFVVAKLSQHLVLNRRQSDIIGQTGKNEFSLLLLRPMYETEPTDATNRIAQVLMESKFSEGQAVGPVEITVTLVDIPTGSKLIQHTINIGRGG